MGGVQAKPRPRRPVFERSISKTTQQVVPTIITSDSSRVLAELLISYQADCEQDKGLRDLDAKLKNGAQQVLTPNTTVLYRLNEAVQCLTHYDEMIKGLMGTLTQKTLESKRKEATKVMTANEKLVDDLVKGYRDISEQTLELCEVELSNLFKSARQVHSCMADSLCKRQVCKNKLNESKMKYHHSAEAVVTKLNQLPNLHREMLNKFTDRILKLDMKLALSRTLKKVVNVLFIGVLTALFVCTIMAAAMASPLVASTFTTHPCIAGLIAAGSVMHAFSPVVKKGRHWILALFEEYESTLEAHKGLIKSMEAGAGDAIKELDGIISQVDKVIEKGNDPLFCKLSSSKNHEDKLGYGTEDPEVIIMGKLADFEQEIEELDQKTNKCHQIVEKTRDQVAKDYSELKDGLNKTTKK